MSGADPLGASRARGAGPGDHLVLGEVVSRVEYDVVGEREERWAQVRSGIATLQEVRSTLEDFRLVNPGITWHVIARTTTTIETLADHLLDEAATERGPQLALDVSAPPPPPGPGRRRWP